MKNFKEKIYKWLENLFEILKKQLSHVISSFIGWSLGISKIVNPYFEQNLNQLN